MILNGSPRAPRSNSKLYAEIFSEKCCNDTEYHNITRSNHVELISRMNEFSEVVLVFPLYADAIPVTLLNFFKSYEEAAHESRLKISVIINCGFLEYEQNDIAVKMIEMFCKKNDIRLGSVLKIGSGEAILQTPFKIFLDRKMRRFAKSIESGKYRTFCVTMPIPKRMFIKASTQYWLNYGKRNGASEEEMRTMKIE